MWWVHSSEFCWISVYCIFLAIKGKEKEEDADIMGKKANSWTEIIVMDLSISGAILKLNVE